jgi:UDP-N-acetylmuramate--alanine ligase
LNPSVQRLRALGVRVHAGTTASPHLRQADIVLYDRQVEPTHSERLGAFRRQIPPRSVLDWLGREMRQGLGLAVVGDREASTATAMIAWTLTRAGLDPTVVLGHSAPQLGGWARSGIGPHFIVEAFESPEGIGPSAPRIAVLLDAGPLPRAEALRAFVASVPEEGSIVALECHRWVADAISNAPQRIDWLSLENREGWWGTDLREDRGCYRFRAFHRGRFAAEVRLQIPGRRNVLSALAALASCVRLEVPLMEIKRGLEEFTGVSRDFESRGSYRGVSLVDDKGWDAIAVGETLELARRRFGPRRIWAVHGSADGPISPCDADRYIPAFLAADHVLIADGQGASSPLVQTLVAAGLRARGTAGLDQLISDLDQRLEPGDVLVTLGTGVVGTIADAFIRRLPRDRPGQ